VTELALKSAKKSAFISPQKRYIYSIGKR